MARKARRGRRWVSSKAIKGPLCVWCEPRWVTRKIQGEDVDLQKRAAAVGQVVIRSGVSIFVLNLCRRHLNVFKNRVAKIEVPK